MAHSGHFFTRWVLGSKQIAISKDAKRKCWLVEKCFRNGLTYPNKNGKTYQRKWKKKKKKKCCTCFVNNFFFLFILYSDNMKFTYQQRCCNSILTNFEKLIDVSLFNDVYFLYIFDFEEGSCQEFHKHGVFSEFSVKTFTHYNSSQFFWMRC